MEALADASLAFCARVEMTDLNGTVDEDVLAVALTGMGATGAEMVSLALPLDRPRSASGSGVNRPRPMGNAALADDEGGRELSSEATSPSSTRFVASGMTVYTPRRVRRSLILTSSSAELSSSDSLDWLLS